MKSNQLQPVEADVPLTNPATIATQHILSDEIEAGDVERRRLDPNAISATEAQVSTFDERAYWRQRLAVNVRSRDGRTLALINHIEVHGHRVGLSGAEIESTVKDMISRDYFHLLTVFEKHFDIIDPIDRPFDVPVIHSCPWLGVFKAVHPRTEKSQVK